MKEQDYIVKEDMICPVTKAHCDDECCPVGSTCNMSNDEILDSGNSFFSEEFKEKMEARRKELNLKWEGWEENERDRQSGGCANSYGYWCIDHSNWCSFLIYVLAVL